MKRATATKHARTTSPLPRCNGGRWQRLRLHVRTRLHTALFSAPNGSRRRGRCPRRCDPADKWSTNRVFPQSSRSFQTIPRRHHPTTAYTIRKRPASFHHERSRRCCRWHDLAVRSQNRRPPPISASLGGNRAVAFLACHARG